MLWTECGGDWFEYGGLRPLSPITCIACIIMPLPPLPRWFIIRSWKGVLPWPWPWPPPIE